jgi:hypothetical protein
MTVPQYFNILIWLVIRIQSQIECGTGSDSEHCTLDKHILNESIQYLRENSNQMPFRTVSAIEPKYIKNVFCFWNGLHPIPLSSNSDKMATSPLFLSQWQVEVVALLLCILHSRLEGNWPNSTTAEKCGCSLLTLVSCTVILFSSRYLFPAKSICPTWKQTIYISMQIRAAAPPNGKTQLIFVWICAAGSHIYLYVG